MPKFREKPVVIEAVQWTGDGWVKDGTPRWFTDAIYVESGKPGRIWAMGKDLMISTLEGDHTASPGDWIIRGVKGELYPCKDEIFTATYDPA